MGKTKNRTRSPSEQSSQQLKDSKTSINESETQKPINEEHEKMLQWLKKVKFRKTLFGGISERDLWKKLDELNSLYEASLLAERARYNTLLNVQKGNAKAKMLEYQKDIELLKKRNAALRRELSDARELE